jgi:DNA-binding NarL/FixJ family response regulator
MSSAAPYGGMRVVIANDDQLVVDGVKRVLEADGGFQVVGEAAPGPQVSRLVGRTKPDIVLLDLPMPGPDRELTCLARICKRHPEVKVAVLSISEDEKMVETAFERGATAYIVKDILNPADLPSTLRQVIGAAYAPLGPHHPQATAASGLTEREKAILSLLATRATHPTQDDLHLDIDRSPAARLRHARQRFVDARANLRHWEQLGRTWDYDARKLFPFPTPRPSSLLILVLIVAVSWLTFELLSR